VRAVANDIEVRLKLDRTDADIAGDAVRVLQLHGAMPDGVQATVHQGHVTLTGSVEWLFQKLDAERVVRHIRGVRGVWNHMTVAPQAGVRDVKRRIVRTLHQNADVDARHIHVAVTGETATLTGVARTWLQREAAEVAASGAPGIVHVDNQIVVEPSSDRTPDDVDDIC
jgi:osmotically-inducible protein OsmY